jgi:hypothetical protein
MGMPIRVQNLMVGMPAWVRITSRSAGPNRPSADFFHTRSSTAASPKAWVNGRPRPQVAAHGSRARTGRPRSTPALPASRNCRFHMPTDCSGTFARRAASATVSAPARMSDARQTRSTFFCLTQVRSNELPVLLLL